MSYGTGSSDGYLSSELNIAGARVWFTGQNSSQHRKVSNKVSIGQSIWDERGLSGQVKITKPTDYYASKYQKLTVSDMLCYVIWLFVKRLSQEAIQRRYQRDRLVKIKVFKLRRDADDIPCNITLRSAGGESFHSAGPTTAKARFWDREVRDQGIRRSQRSAERSGREERADGGLDMS